MMSIYKDKLNGNLFRKIRIPSHFYGVHWIGPMAKKRQVFGFFGSGHDIKIGGLIVILPW